MNVLVINGPNINMLGIREPEIYGKATYRDLVSLVKEKGESIGVDVDFYQSNCEGDIVTAIQNAYNIFDAIIINPAAYTHTSIAILDALKSVGLPAVEVHISKVDEREPFRQISYVGMYCEHTITGKGIDGYVDALEYLVKKYML